MSEATKPAQRKKSTAPADISLRKNANRVVLGFTIWCLGIAMLTNTQTNIVGSLVSAALILYVCGSGIWLRISKLRNHKYPNYCHIATADALIYSASLAYFCACYSCLTAIFSIVMLHAALNGGIRQTINDGAAFFIGASAITLLAGKSWQFGMSTTQSSIVYIGMIVYLIIYGLDIYSKVKRLNSQNNKLHNDVVLHKLRGYKLSRYVSPTVWNALNKGRESTLKTERKRVSVFFSDIAGFSALSEELEAETLTELLNTYLTEMVKIAAAHRGTIDKFMGDGLMVIFGDTNSDGMKSDCLRCVAMAIDMRKKMRELETKWFNQGIKKPLKIRMGINSGFCTVGTFGTSEYMDYTVLGTHVNLASRLESAADSGEILISHETWSLIKDVVMCRDRGEIKAKGFSHPIKVYQVIDFRKEMGKNQSYFEDHTNGFSIHLDLERIKNYDRERIISNLEKLVEKVRDKI